MGKCLWECWSENCFVSESCSARSLKWELLCTMLRWLPQGKHSELPSARLTWMQWGSSGWSDQSEWNYLQYWCLLGSIWVITLTVLLQCKMEKDTGATLTMISESTYRQACQAQCLQMMKINWSELIGIPQTCKLPWEVHVEHAYSASPSLCWM